MTTLARATDDEVRGRATKLVEWADRRIAHCRELENKFCASARPRAREISQTAIESWSERGALQQVIAILNGEEP